MAGLARDRTIGRAGGIPWRYSEDLRAFKRATMGTVLVMGRKTLESIGRALPGRVNVVVTRSPAALAARWPDVVAVASLEAAIAHAADVGAETVSVIGGGEIYRLALPLADELLLTFVPEDGAGDTFFPAWDATEWEEVSRERTERVEVVRLVRQR